MIISDLLISAASFVMVIAGWMGTLSTGLILAVLLCRSVGSAFHTPCLQAVTPQIVPEDQMRRVFPGPGVRVADTESGSGSCFIQFLEFERNYLPGRHRGAGSSVHPGNYRDTGTAAGDG